MALSIFEHVALESIFFTRPVPMETMETNLPRPAEVLLLKA